jgi:hypothetical protein
MLFENVLVEQSDCFVLAAVRFGPWAMAEGETPNMSPRDCATFRKQGYHWLFDQVSSISK